MPQVERASSRSAPRSCATRAPRTLSRFLDRHAGTEVELLVEKGGIGRTRQFAEMRVPAAVPAGALVRARVSGHDGQRLSGEVWREQQGRIQPALGRQERRRRAAHDGGASRSAGRVADATRPPKATGWFGRLKQGLGKTSAKLTDGITGIFTKKKLEAATLEDLEDLLIEADLGIGTAENIITTLRKGRYEKNISADDVRSRAQERGGARAGSRRQAARRRRHAQAARHPRCRRQRHRQDDDHRQACRAAEPAKARR